MSCTSFATFRGLHAPAPVGELALSTPIYCDALHCILAARICALRQRIAARQTTRDLHRGTAPTYPRCLHCPQGASLGAPLGLAWRGEGAGGRSERLRTGGIRAMLAARRRLEAVGLLEIPPTMDEPPPEPDEAPAPF